jgi:surface-anchored protein
LTDEHVDIGVAYEGGLWDLHVHDETNDIEYEPDEALLFAGMNSRTPRPGGSQWDFFGVPSGQTIWILPQTQVVGRLFLGVGAEEIAGGTFDSYVNNDPRIGGFSGEWITLTVMDVRGPGHFSVYQTDSFGTPTVWAATSDGLDSTDLVYALAGGHAHYNWGFTSAGMYEVDIVASAFQNGNLLQSDVATYHFGVEAVPEPATLLALATGALVLLRRRRRS